MRVELGNTNPKDADGPSITTVNVPDTDTPDEALRSIVHDDGLWSAHSLDQKPAWVEADDPTFARRLAAYYDVPVGRPDDWEAQL